jgi:HK97 gp10 family phage protein
MANVGITGGEDLIAALREFPVKLEVQVMASALRGGAKVVQAQAVQNVPVDSGDLRDSIKIRRRTNKRTGYINLLVSAGNKRAWYAHIIEFGAKAHIIKPRARKSLVLAGLLREIVNHPGARASGFMRRAFDQTANGAVDEVARLTKKGIERLEWRRSKGRI